MTTVEGGSQSALSFVPITTGDWIGWYHRDRDAACSWLIVGVLADARTACRRGAIVPIRPEDVASDVLLALVGRLDSGLFVAPLASPIAGYVRTAVVRRHCDHVRRYRAAAPESDLDDVQERDLVDDRRRIIANPADHALHFSSADVPPERHERGWVAAEARHTDRSETAVRDKDIRARVRIALAGSQTSLADAIRLTVGEIRAAARSPIAGGASCSTSAICTLASLSPVQQRLVVLIADGLSLTAAARAAQGDPGSARHALGAALLRLREFRDWACSSRQD